MSIWKQRNDATKAAMNQHDFAHADALLAETFTAAGDDQALVANTHFTEGMLRDVQGRFEEAEAAFANALAIDRALHGPSAAAAVADALNSLAIIRHRRKDLEGSLAAYREQAEVLRISQPFDHARGQYAVGTALLELERLDEALVAFEAAADAFDEDDATPLHDYCRAHLGAGEAHRRAKRFPAAFGSYALATHVDGAALVHEVGDAVARAWWSIGFVSRHGLQHTGIQAASAFWYAAQIAPPPLRARAEQELATLDDKRFATGDPLAWRVTYNHARHVHVASLTRGMFHTVLQVTAQPGEIVDVEYDQSIGLIMSVR